MLHKISLLSFLSWMVYCGSPPLEIEIASPETQKTQELASNQQDDRESFIFGFAPFTEPKRIKAMYSNFAEYLSEKLQLKVRVIVVEDYDTLLDNLRTGVIQAAFLSPINFIKVTSDKSFGVTYCVSAEIYGKTSYYGDIIAHRSSGIRSLSGIRNQKFAFVDRNSASGFVYPYATLLRSGINPERDFSRIFFLGTHARVLEALKAGRVAAGTTYDGKLSELSKEEAKNYVILRRTSPIPYDAIVLTKTGVSKRDAIRRILLSLDKDTKLPDGRLVFDPSTSVGVTGFKFRDISLYNDIKELMRRIKL